MDKFADFFKLLSDETRLRILIMLFHKKFCVCELFGIGTVLSFMMAVTALSLPSIIMLSKV